MDEELIKIEKVIGEINYFFDMWALRPNYAMEQAKEYLQTYVEEQVNEAVKAERDRILNIVSASDEFTGEDFRKLLRLTANEEMNK